MKSPFLDQRLRDDAHEAAPPRPPEPGQDSLDGASLGDASRTHDPARARALLLLFAASVATMLLGRWYVADLAAQVAPRPNPSPLLAQRIFIGALIQGSIVAGFGWIGLRLGPRIGLGAPDLLLLVHPRGASVAPVVRRSVTGFLLGLAVGIALLGVAALMPEIDDQTNVRQPAWWKGLLASLQAGVVEEVVFRLGVMTALAAALRALAGGGVAGAGTAWTANGAAALLFGLVHLPNVTRYGGELTPAIVAVVVGGNLVAGLAFGWVYWRLGLVPAMATHFGTDVILHAIVPAFAPN